MQRPLCQGMGYFTVVWFGHVVSIIGSGMTGFAIGTTLYRDTGSVTLYALIGLASFGPVILLSPLAGVVADRFDRRHVLIVADFFSALGTLLLWQLASSGDLASWHLYAIVAARASSASFVWPSLSSATTLIVGKGHYGRASGMIQMGASVGQIFSPLLGGLLVGPLGVSGVIIIDVATYMFAITTLLLLRFPQPEKRDSTDGATADGATADGATAAGAAATAGERVAGRRPRQAVTRGGMGVAWQFIRERPALIWLLGLFAAINFLAGIIQASMAPMILSFTTRRVLGFVLAGASLGGLVGGIMMSVWGGPPPHRRVLTVLKIVFIKGVLLLVGGLQANVALIGSAAFCFMIGFPIAAGCSQAIWQSKVPPEIQGRVFALRRMIAGGSLPLAYMVTGPLADYVFEPMLAPGGLLASSVGGVIGVGPGRGIAFSFMLYGVLNILIVMAALRSRPLHRLDEEVPDIIDGAPARDHGRLQRALSGLGLDRLGKVPALVLVAVLALVAAGTIVGERPPAELTGAELGAFSAERVLADVEVVARSPHPTGSAANREVRDFLVSRLQELGLETQVQAAETSRTIGPVTALVTVENVLARLPGHGGGRAVMLAAHYDSVATAPGAGDNAAAVGVLLEAARLLAEGPPLRNDVIFFFPDAEEIALGGASAFVSQHPWVHDVAMVVNFDARGHGGPVYLFQTGDDNAWWIRQASGVLPEPRTSSLLNQIYRYLPNQTDFTVFLEAGLPGFNHAFLEGLTHYHSPLDEVEDLDPRSVLHQGSYALALTRHFGELDLSTAEDDGEDQAYFSVLGAFVVHYSRGVAVASIVLVSLLFVAVIGLGLKRGRLTVGGLAQGLLASLATMIAIPVALTLVWFLIRDLVGATLLLGSTPGAYLYMIAFSCLAFAAYVALLSFLCRFVGVADLAVGALFWWWLLAVLTSGPSLPADSNFLFVWPLAASLLGLGYLLRAPAGGGDAEGEASAPGAAWRTAAVLALTALPGIVIVVPFIAIVYVGLQSLVQLGGAPLVLELLLLGALIPQLRAVMGRHPARWAVAAAAAGLVVLGLAANNSMDSRLRLETVFYAHDADSGTDYWYSVDDKLGEWTRQFGFESDERGPVSDFRPFYARRELWRSPAPAVQLPSPAVEVLGQQRLTEQLRDLEIRLSMPGGSELRNMWFEPAHAVSSLRLGERAVSLGAVNAAFDKPRILRVPGPQEEVLTLRLQTMEPVTLHVVEQLAGLPEVAGLSPRPEDVLVRPLPIALRSDVTLIRRSYVLPGVSEAQEEEAASGEEPASEPSEPSPEDGS